MNKGLDSFRANIKLFNYGGCEHEPPLEGM